MTSSAEYQLWTRYDDETQLTKDTASESLEDIQDIRDAILKRNPSIIEWEIRKIIRSSRVIEKSS